MTYTPPSPEDLIKLRDELGLTQSQMAELVGLAGGNQWRKYTGGQNPRKMGLHMAFYLSAKLCLSEDDLGKICEKMRDFGVNLD